jgi:hypothetical protein
VRAGLSERLEVVDLKTNVGSEKDLALALAGKGKSLKLSGHLIDISQKPIRDLAGKGSGNLKLVVLRADQAIGHVRLSIGDK